MMYLENPRSTERDNQNALRKYPFADAASCGNGACVIPPGALVDAQLYVPGRTAGPVWLSLADEEGNLHFSDSSGEFAVTSQPVQPLSAVPVTFTGDGGPLPGGVVVCGREGDVASLLGAGRQSFERGQAELAPAAVTFTGARGVTGFRLDDGNTVWGAVRIRGANGCDVATYERDGVKYLRISAIGQTVTDTGTTGFITRVVAESNNASFTVSPLKDADGTEIVPNRCVLVSPTGAQYLGDDDVPYDQEDACEAVKRARGTLPSESATVPPDCGSGICGGGVPEAHVITFRAEGSEDVRKTVLDGGPLPTVDRIPEKDGFRFIGYYRETDGGHLEKYYDSVGSAVKRTFTDSTDITLTARWIVAYTEAVATFSGYGTLHILAPDTVNYSNPLRISGGPGLVPQVRTLTPSELADGGADALASFVLNPATAAGEVHLSLRGLQKAFDS